MLVPERRSELVIIHTIPCVVKGHFVVELFIVGIPRAAHVNPAFVKVATKVLVAIDFDRALFIIVKCPLIWDKVVECVYDVVVPLYNDIIGKCP